MEYRVIDADSHVNSPRDLYASRVPKRFRERAPRIVSLDEWDAWVVDGAPPTPLTVLSAAAGKTPEQLAERKLIRFEEMRPGCHDPKARLADLDQDGIDAQVLFGDGAAGARDPELGTVLIRAYNDWLAEFCAVAPERYIGLAVMPTHDPTEALKEAERTADMPGLRGLFLGVEGANYPITDTSYDRFWAAAAEQGRPVALHIGASRQTDKSRSYGANAAPGTLEAWVSTAPMSIAESIAMLIFGGTLERHPELRIVIAEGSIGWLAYFLERMDNVMAKQGRWAGSTLPERPSHYFHRQILATFEEDLAGMRTYDLVGSKNIMWSSDYPHSDTTWPHSRRAIEEHFGSVPDADRRAMTCENAGRLYGLL